MHATQPEMWPLTRSRTAGGQLWPRYARTSLRLRHSARLATEPRLLSSEERTISSEMASGSSVCDASGRYSGGEGLTSVFAAGSALDGGGWADTLVLDEKRAAYAPFAGPQLLCSGRNITCSVRAAGAP